MNGSAWTTLKNLISLGAIYYPVPGIIGLFSAVTWTILFSRPLLTLWFSEWSMATNLPLTKGYWTDPVKQYYKPKGRPTWICIEWNCLRDKDKKTY